VKQALTRGHRVTAFVHRPDSLPITHDAVRVVVGDATRADANVDTAIRGQDVVVSALGRRNSFSSDHLMTRSMQAIVPSMEAAGVRRLIMVSAFGVGASRRDAPIIPRILYFLLLRDIFADKARAEDIVRRSSVDWTILYPVLLTDGPLTARYRVGERLELRGIPKVSRADVAHFALTVIEDRAFVRKGAVISY
jgi:putative NADH-flavin reductase